MAKNEYFKRTSQKAKEEDIPKILAGKFKKPYTHFSMKLDGTHAELHIGDDIKFITRDGNDVAHLVPYLVDTIKAKPNWKALAGVYACELVHLDKVLNDPKDCWSASRRVLGRKEYDETLPMIQCVIYDLHSKVFDEGIGDKHYFHRRLALPRPDYTLESKYTEFAVPCYDLPNFHIPVLYQLEHLSFMWNEFIIERKNEGFCLVDMELSHTYKWEHTFCKLKPSIDVDAIVLGYFEGKKGTRLEGRIGAFEVGLYKQTGSNYEIVSIGKVPTMNEKQRVFWTERMRRGILSAKLVDGTDAPFVIQVKASEVTSGNKLRFPSYVRERTDKKPIECTWEQLS